MVVSGDDFLRLLPSGFGFAPDRCGSFSFSIISQLKWSILFFARVLSIPGKVYH